MRRPCSRSFRFLILAFAPVAAVVPPAARPASAAAVRGAFVLPWVAPTRGASTQSSDLEIFNPGHTTMTVSMVFRRRGTPEDNPPRPSLKIAPGHRFHGNGLQQIVRESVSGYLVGVTDGDAAPVVLSYNTTLDAQGNRLSREIAALDTAPAGAGQEQVLLGLEQDAGFATTVWLFNPGGTAASAALSFVADDGSVLGSLPAVQVPAGGSFELGPNQLPLVAHSRTGPFTLRVAVASGELIAAAQVLDKKTNDAAYVPGQ